MIGMARYTRYLFEIVPSAGGLGLVNSIDRVTKQPAQLVKRRMQAPVYSGIPTSDPTWQPALSVKVCRAKRRLTHMV